MDAMELRHNLVRKQDMRNFHVHLPDETYNHLRTAAERLNVPASALAHEAIDVWLRQQFLKARHDAIAAYAAEMAGTSLDLNTGLETVGIEHLIEAGVSSKNRGV
jgi:predicted transcriptional regulator